MISAKTLTWFLLRLVLIESLLIAPWPGVGAMFRQVFNAAGNLVIGGMSHQRAIKFQSLNPPRGLLDVEVSVIDPRAGNRGTMPISSRHFGWMPIAFAIALTLATPPPPKRRGWALPGGLLGVLFITCALVLARVWIAILVKFSDASNPDPWPLWPPLRAALVHIDGALSVPMIGWYVLPLLIWMGWLLMCGRAPSRGPGSETVIR